MAIINVTDEQSIKEWQKNNEFNHCFKDVSQHEPGAKNDHGKVRVGLMMSGFANALSAVSEVTTFGSNKYTPNGWVNVENGIERYTDAMLRHFLSESMGETFDTESELMHASHLAWNALARLELMIRYAKKA